MKVILILKYVFSYGNGSWPDLEIMKMRVIPETLRLIRGGWYNFFYFA